MSEDILDTACAIGQGIHEDLRRELGHLVAANPLLKAQLTHPEVGYTQHPMTVWAKGVFGGYTVRIWVTAQPGISPDLWTTSLYVDHEHTSIHDGSYRHGPARDAKFLAQTAITAITNHARI